MIYCSFEPGLLSLRGLGPDQVTTAFEVINSLHFHREAIRNTQAKIPATAQLINIVIADLNNLSIKNPPIQKQLREIVIEILSRQVLPSLIPTGLEDVQIAPDITSTWVEAELKNAWIDSITAALADLSTTNNNRSEMDMTVLATWPRNDLPFEIKISSESLASYLAVQENMWAVPIVANSIDWRSAKAELEPWGNNIETLVEVYAHRYLGIPISDIANRRSIRYEEVCFRELRQEGDLETRKQIIDVLACRAYDRLQPHHHNERIKGQKGMWRVYVKKMAPSIRLHYYFDNDDTVYSLYSNNDHDKGL